MPRFAVISALTLAAIWPALLQAQEITKVVKRVEADGMPFKVTIEGNKATVVRRGFFFKLDAQLYFAAKKAAEIASGCRVVEGFGGDVGMYYATLDCSRTQRSD